MLEIFEYSFMVRAFLAGGIIGIIAPLIGTFLVAKRYSLMADSLAHVSLAGVALGLLTGIYPIYTAIIVAIITALVVEYLRTRYQVAGDTALAMFLSGGLALAIVLIGLHKGANVDLFAYLFGSITTVQSTDLWVIGGLGSIVLLAVMLFYNKLVYLSFDEEAAKVSGVPTKFLNTILMILTAVTVSVSMRVVGVLLIGALMVIPVVTATQLRQSFRATLLIAVGLSILAVIAGLFAAYYFNLAAGGSIVVVSLGIFLFTLLLKK